MKRDNDLSASIIGALSIDVETAAIVSDAVSAIIRLADSRGLSQRIAIANACAQMIVALGDNGNEERVQYAASLVALCVDARLDYARVCERSVGFVASATAKENAS